MLLLDIWFFDINAKNLSLTIVLSYLFTHFYLENRVLTLIL